MLGEAFRGIGDQMRARMFAPDAELRVALEPDASQTPPAAHATRRRALVQALEIDYGRSREAYIIRSRPCARAIGVTGAAGGISAVFQASAAQALGPPGRGPGANGSRPCGAARRR